MKIVLNANELLALQAMRVKAQDAGHDRLAMALTLAISENLLLPDASMTADLRRYAKVFGATQRKSAE